MAKRWLDAHEHWLDWTGVVLGRSEAHALWASYYSAAHDLTRAYPHPERVLLHASDPRQPLALLAAHRPLGQLDTAVSSFETAHDHLNTSLRIAAACAAPFERVLSLLALAELQIAQGHKQGAWESLAEAWGIGTPLGALPALPHADSLARRLAGATRSLSSYPANLSERAVEVLRLMASGLTNRAIAERLVLSPHTVKTNVSNIFNKLMVTTRAGAMRFALDRHLT